MYKIFFTREAEKEYSYLYKTNRYIFERIKKALFALAEEPRQGKPLKLSLKGIWSYRVGMYRIIYKIQQNQLIVTVIDIGHRREIY